MDTLTRTVSQNPYTLSLLAEGGAAGSGGSVVSEGQGYAVLTAGISLASLDINDSKRSEATTTFWGYFNGWKRMCINSTNQSACQTTKYCSHDAGQAPCLPGWKHDGGLTQVQGTGAAPDADGDAIVGMIISLKALEKDPSKPIWYDEVMKWTDESCTQYLQDNTELSSSGSHRLSTLGSCWGGWNSNGNNPSYPSPGAFRAMRDFQISYDGSRTYTMPDFGDNLNVADKWNMLIDTTYKFYETTQCAETGIVPNWALVKESTGSTLAKQSGSFSGSGTPQYEFGAEASRTLWRVAFDAALYPEESFEQTESFLQPVHQKLKDNFNNGANDWYDNALEGCEYVNMIFSSWKNVGFIFSPVYSTLVIQAQSMSRPYQQTLVNAACGLIRNIPSSYYSRSWQVIGMMTLNGDMKKVGNLLRDTGITQTPTTIHVPTKSPNNGPVESPTKAPIQTPSLKCKSACYDSTKPWNKLCKKKNCAGCPECSSPPSGPPVTSPTNAPIQQPVGQDEFCCTWDFYHCGKNIWCNESMINCQVGCSGGVWMEKSAPEMQCVAKWGTCTSDNNGCCADLTCEGNEFYKQCL